MGQRRNGLSKNTLLDDRFRARSLLRSLIWRALKFPQNQRCRAKITLHHPNQGVAPFSGPSCRTFLSVVAGHGGCRGGLVEGIAALLGSENVLRYRGVSQLQSHQSRYSVQLRKLVGEYSCLFLGEERFDAYTAPTPTPLALLSKVPILPRTNFVLTITQNSLTKGNVVANRQGGSCSKAAGGP